MNFELAIATMNKNEEEVLNMVKQMNVKCNCLVIVQCDQENNTVIHINEQKIRIIYTKERGLSRSRNMAIMNSEADIMGIADDDLYYYDNFDKTILDYYDNNPKADVVMFNIDTYQKKWTLKDKKISYINCLGMSSVQTTIKIEKILDKNLIFNKYFGTGSGIINSGEENIFLKECIKKKCKIFYCSKKILKNEESASSWFNGYSDKKYLKDRGAIFYELSKCFFLLLVLQFAIRKRKLFYSIKIITAIKYMVEGKEEYIKKCLYNCDNLNI